MDEDYEIRVLQWVENLEGTIQLPNILYIYAPEPYKILVKYLRFRMEEIPE